MIKFIIEVEEGYINKSADPKVLFEKAKLLGGKEAISIMADMIYFSAVQKKVKEGQTEFVINQEKLKKDAYKIFDHVVAKVAALAGILTKEAHHLGENKTKNNEEDSIQHTLRSGAGRYRRHQDDDATHRARKHFAHGKDGG